jgi:serine/threonine-protein kinase
MPQTPQDTGVHALFERLLEERPERRSAFLDRTCAGRPALRERIEHLVRRAEHGGFLDAPAIRTGGVADVPASTWAAGHVIGAYRLLRPLGRGGMAEVWLAEREEGGFRQEAAVKLIARASASLSQRFAAERSILAALAHPRIARLYEGGVEADGTAYMVMEYVDGEHLIDYATAQALPLGARMDLFLQICDAVAYAHTRLVVHRDLKPANILVTAERNAMLLDFGIAKLLDADAGADRTRTLYLSPTHAAPEQLTGDAIGTATDVYALGVILFELLTGRLPWRDDAAPMATAVKRLLDAPLPLPSRSADADSPVAPRMLRGDLDAIVAKALRREPDQRYADARALADDVRRHLEHRAVRARSGARAYVARRFLRRNWLPLSSTALLFAALAASTIAVTWQAQRARSDAQRAQAVQEFMVNLFKANSSRQKDPVKARQTTARELLDIGAGRIETALAGAPQARLALLRTFGTLYEDLAVHAQAQRFRRDAAALSGEVFGRDSPEHVDALLDLATSDFSAGALADTEPVLGEIGAILDRRADTSSPQRGRWLINSAYVHRSDLARAHREAEQAVQILGAFPPSAELAEALYAKGMNESRMGRPMEAVASLSRAVGMSRATEGVPNTNLPVYYYLLASAQKDLLQYGQAEASARQALAFAIAINGEDHPDAIRSRSMLALILAESDRMKEGLAVANDVRAAVARVLGAGDPIHGIVALQSCMEAELRAGDLGHALEDSRSTLAQARKLPPRATNIAAALERAAELSIELGRREDAVDQLDEADAARGQLEQAPTNRGALLRIRLALDEDRLDDARARLIAFVPGGASPGAVRVATAQHDLLEAELELHAGNTARAAQLAGASGARIGAGELAQYLRSLHSDGELIEGLAHLRGGDAGAARPLLDRALATRAELYLPASPRIAEAELALAECDLAQGRGDEATRHMEQAAAIEAQHASLARRYTEPLQRMRERLAGARPSYTPSAS